MASTTYGSFIDDLFTIFKGLYKNILNLLWEYKYYL